MSSLVTKWKKNKPYLYWVRSARVEGKPRIVEQIYLGPRERVLEQLRTQGAVEKLERILQELKDNWAELEAVLHRFIEEELQRGREQEVAGLDPKMQAPFFGLLKEAIEANSGVPLADPAFRTAVDTTVAIVAHIQDEIRRVGFWRDVLSRQRLENWVYRRLNRLRLMPSDKVQELAVRMVDLAKHRHRFLVL